jgi:Tfp pilus assembly protein PilV
MNSKKSQGLLLIEVLISLVLMAAIVAGVFGSFVSSQRITTRANHRLLATNYTRQALEQLKSAVRADQWANPNDGDPLDLTPVGPPPVPRSCGINLGSFALPPFNATCVYEVQSILNDCRKVDLRITWTEP